MGKRSREDKRTIYVGSDNKILKDLEERKRQILKANSEMTAKWISSWQSDYMKLDSTIRKRMRDISDIAAATGVSVDSVAQLVQYKTDDELDAAARESRTLYQDRVESMDFRSVLTDEQIKSLLPVMNDYVFVEAQTLDSVRLWLRCEVTEPVKVKNNGLLAFLMYLLSHDNYICSNWQKVAQERKVFVGSQGGLLTQKGLSKAMSLMAKRKNYPMSYNGGYLLNNEIYNAVEGLKG